MSPFLRIPLLYIFTTIAVFAAIDEPRPSFQAGIEAYENGQYETAKTEFISALETNEDPATRHNLGLTYFQLGNFAEATWQLERAQLLAPLNGDYRYKLEAVRQELGLFAGTPKWYLLASEALPTKTWLIIASISFWLFLATLLLPRLSGAKIGIRIKSLRFISIFALILSIPCIWLNYGLLQSGTVIANEAISLHAAPASAAPESGAARPGERACILDQYNNFYKIKTEGLATGWILKDAFRPIAPE